MQDLTPYLAIGLAGVLIVIAFVWIHRITRNPDAGDDHWRSHH
jgi:hypothetical protein